MKRMSKKTRAALEASIAKWERNAVAEKPTQYLTGWRDCPLCLLYIENDCQGCPVAKAGHEACEGTPYDAAYEARADWGFDYVSKRAKDRSKTAALAEVAFLKSLLPTA